MKKVIPGKPFLFLALTAFISAVTMACIKIKPVRAYMYDGEEPSSQLIVDKRVKALGVTEWQDNLSSSQITLKEDDLIGFEIVVKNTGETELKNIDVKDHLPSYLRFIFGPNNPDNQEINWNIDHLNPGEERSFQIRMQIDGVDQVSEGTFCLLNKVSARAESGEYDEDTASFCLMGAKELPESGTGNLITGTLITSIVAITGIFLRKFGRGEILA